jgi:putative oxidoreductase
MTDATLLRRVRTDAHALARTLAPVAPLLARITLGAVFVSSGWGKLHNLEKVAGFFADLGIPAPASQALLVSGTELVGGALVLVGLGARLASLPLAVTMAVAIATAKRAELSGATDLFGLVEWTYLVLLAWVAIAGPGRFSLDALLDRPRAPRLAVAPVAP